MHGDERTKFHHGGHGGPEALTVYLSSLPPRRGGVSEVTAETQGIVFCVFPCGFGSHLAHRRPASPAVSDAPYFVGFVSFVPS